MALLSRDSILAATDRRYAEVSVPEWGGTVRIASLTAEQALQYREKQEGSGNDHVWWILAASIVDEEGKQVFTPDDVPALKQRNPLAVLRIAKEAMKLNALDVEGERGN